MYIGEGNGTPLQYSCLENPMDGGAWQAAVHGVAKSRTRLSDFTFHFHALEKEMATLQCSCLENPRDSGAWWAAVYGVGRTESDMTEATQQQQQQRCIYYKQLGPERRGGWRQEAGEKGAGETLL